jgi:hypothetical protein
MKIKAQRLGDLQVVKNTKKHWAAKDKYNFIRVQTESGQEISLLFTDAEIKRANERALKNPEDLPSVSKFRDIFD